MDSTSFFGENLFLLKYWATFIEVNSFPVLCFLGTRIHQKSMTMGSAVFDELFWRSIPILGLLRESKNPSSIWMEKI